MTPSLYSLQIKKTQKNKKEEKGVYLQAPISATGLKLLFPCVCTFLSSFCFASLCYCICFEALSYSSFPKLWDGSKCKRRWVGKGGQDEGGRWVGVGRCFPKKTWGLKVGQKKND